MYKRQGQVAGVQTTSNNGQPGKDAEVRIRGIGSISASNKPLYVVDGVPYDGESSAISTSDIESMTVLKDAASNALYGCLLYTSFHNLLAYRLILFMITYRILIFARLHVRITIKFRLRNS